MVGRLYPCPTPDATPFIAVSQEVTEDTVWSADDLHGPDGPAIAAYEWLGIVQTELVEALLGALPD